MYKDLGIHRDTFGKNKLDMKQRILIFCAVVTTLSLSAFGYVNWKDANPNMNEIISDTTNKASDFDFVYSMQNRFQKTITKEKIDQALSITDIIPVNENNQIESYFNILLTAFAESRKDWIQVRGTDEHLDDAQLLMIQTFGYGSSFSITGNIKKLDETSGQLVNDTIIHYMTVVPDNPTTYKDGTESLINYLKENSADVIAIAKKDQVQPGKISFLVTEDGSIDQVSLKNTSGYTLIDEKMLSLIREIPGSWKIAINAKGEKVAQKLVFFFGSMGC